MSTVDAPAPPKVGRRAKLPGWLKGLLGLLAILGPGLISANAGNDAGGILTYASAMPVCANTEDLLSTIGCIYEVNIRACVGIDAGLSESCARHIYFRKGKSACQDERRNHYSKHQQSHE